MPSSTRRWGAAAGCHHRLVDDDDWRLSSPGADLAGHTFRWAEWVRRRDDWDHDHCEFCWAKMTDLSKPDTDDHEYFSGGWVTAAASDGGRWVCPTCFRELSESLDLRATATG